MREDRQRYFKDWRFPNEIAAAVNKRHPVSPKGAGSCKSATGPIRRDESWAWPQGLECPCERAVKARGQRAAELNRAFSAHSFVITSPGAVPQAVGDDAPLSTCRRELLLALFKFVLAN